MPGQEAENSIRPADRAPFEMVSAPGLRSRLTHLMRSRGDLATVIRGAGGTLAIKLVSAPLLFTVQAVLARLLGVESYGVYSIAYAWLMMLLLLVGDETVVHRFYIL